MSEQEDPLGWSQPFVPSTVARIEALAPFEAVTPEWAWGGGTGKGVKVAVIDSGVEDGHPMVGKVNGFCLVREGAGGVIEYDTNPHPDVFGHGTACAGIIRSLAPECEIYSVRVLGPLLKGKAPVFIGGLKWAVDNGMHVCNLSLTTPNKAFYAALQELADLAYYKRTVLVTAANNLPIESFPAMFSSVISVASHDVNDPYRYYYNPAPPVEFGAHGIDVKVAWVRGGSMTSTGNSFATPHIAGLVAKILGKHPELTPFQVKAVLWALAANVGEDTTGPERADQPAQRT